VRQAGFVVDDFDACYRAVRSRDPRFDGWFFTAVRTTGIYCRPSCPAATPKPENVEFFPSAAAAQQAGYRACKRCRPDASPGSPEWDLRGDAAARAVRLIADGVVDREGVPGLARRVGYSVRQIERLLTEAVGASPLALARAQRAQTARILIETTDLPISQVAFGAGFASLRQFNDTIRAVFGLTPTELRRRSSARPTSAAPGAVSLRLPFRAPFDSAHALGHLAARAVPGVEEVVDGVYRRGLDLPGGTGTVSLRFPDATAERHVAVTLRLADFRDLTAAISRLRRLLDLDSDPEAVDAVLGSDPVLAQAVAAHPGRRVVRTVDEQEMALRAVLGQQVSLGAARRHAGRLAERLGQAIDDPEGGLRWAFPRSDLIAGAPDDAFGLPATRRRALRALADALATGRIQVGPGADRQECRARLRDLPGVGPWTVEVVAMRALGDPDAFPAGDLGLRRAAQSCGLSAGPSALARAERWRPWRSYAAQYLSGLYPIEKEEAA
jgi:AraC family transcriptional regulator of adaptative response / DNA-3-methyladenine glycosylase II